MGTFIDLAGQKFGRLTVLERVDNRNGRIYWKCLCECGNYCNVSTKTLRNGTARSCGCIRIELLKQRVCKHSLTNTRLYGLWKNIKKRCYCKKYRDYHNYGGRGVKMCEEWKNDFTSFNNWALENGYDINAPRGKYTIDRINNDGNYEPSNCRWITIEEQQRNKRNNHFITYNNETHTIAEWAKLYNISYKMLFKRLKDGWDIERALLTPKIVFKKQTAETGLRTLP